jgi:hypothetical protein
MLFHLLTGERPVPGETPEELRAALDSGVLPDVLASRPDVPLKFAAAVSRALAPQPRDRWPTVADLLAAADVDEVW